MKRNIIYITLVAVGILLSACGSNSRENPVPTPTPPPGGYVLANLTSELEIEEYKTYPIKFQLTKNGLVVPESIVSMKVPDNSIGSIQAYDVTTDVNGKGVFVYTPPAIFPEKGQLTIVFKDGNITIEENVTLNFNLNTDIPSDGRATTLSISYETTECDDKRGIIGHYHVHAVDRFSRLPIVDIPVRVSLINGIKQINNKKVQIAKGSIYNYDPIEFIDKSINFETQTNVEKGDNLIIFPSEGKTDVSYLGGWDIRSVSDYLILNEYYYNLLNATNLTYIIGNEERLLGGENGTVGILANAHVEPNYTTDNNGFAYFDIVFDPILAGHTVTVEAHGNEDGNRVGISMKTALRLDGDFSAPERVVENSGGLETSRIPLSIDPSCLGTQPLIDVPIQPGSFHVTPEENCMIDEDISDYHTDGYGTVTIAVQTDGNTTATGKCTITWDGGITSMLYEY